MFIDICGLKLSCNGFIFCIGVLCWIFGLWADLRSGAKNGDLTGFIASAWLFG